MRPDFRRPYYSTIAKVYGSVTGLFFDRFDGLRWNASEPRTPKNGTMYYESFVKSQADQRRDREPEHTLPAPRSADRLARTISKFALFAFVATLAVALLAKVVLPVAPGPKRSELGAVSRTADLANMTGAAEVDALPILDMGLMPLKPEDARSRNAQTLFAKRPIEIAPPFVLARTEINAKSWDDALLCLTQANYYEAASEGDQGMRAVSQVVLNRLRHRIYPKTICEVVYEGAARSTGCQFTFTCDGSLGQVPIPAIWARAKRIASDALSGSVMGSVGMATHYHTDWVVPYWAGNLDKIQIIGRHIFYVWKGAMGSRAAFDASRQLQDAAASAKNYGISSQGNDPTLRIAAERVEIETPLSLPNKENARQDIRVSRSNLLADEARGSLKADTEKGNLDVKPAERRQLEGVNGNGQ